VRADGRESGNSHEDVTLSRLYQQVTELQGLRFGAGYDLGQGLERYQAWLGEHTGDPGRQDGAEGDGALPVTVTGTLVASDAVLPDAFAVSGTARAEWSADLAIVEL
jgi:hypothetical protein